MKFKDFVKKYKFLFIMLSLVQLRMIYDFFSSEPKQLIYSFDGNLPYLDFSFLQNSKYQAALQWFICANFVFIILYSGLYYNERKNNSKALQHRPKRTEQEMKNE